MILLCPQTRFFSSGMLPSSCSHRSVSSGSEKISKDFSSPTSYKIEKCELEYCMCKNSYELVPVEETSTCEIRSLWER